MNAVERVLDRLERVKKSGPGWTARCPAHEDRIPSLAVREGGDGRALVHCHAGCTLDAIVGAAGLDVCDLFEDHPRPDNGPRRREGGWKLPDVDGLHATLLGNAAALTRLEELRGWTWPALAHAKVGLDGDRRVVFPYRDADGVVVGAGRYQPNPARRNGSPKLKADAGSRRDLFPSPERLPGKGWLFVVEGEPDALRAFSCGLPAVAVPGVQGWRSEWADRFSGRRVVVCFDCDASGRDAARRIAADLEGVAADVRILDLDQGRDDGYDLTDFAAAARTSSEREEVRRIFLDCAEKAPTFVSPSSNETRRKESSATRFRLRPLAAVEARQVRWLVPGLIPLRTLTLVAGVGGLGKSTWLLAVAAQGSRGDLGEPWDTIVVSFEDPAAEVIRPRVEAAAGDLHRIHEVIFDGDGIDAVSLPRDIDALQGLIREARARLLVIDPVVAAIETSFDTHKDQHVRAVLARLALVAEEEDCAAAIVGHLNKAPSTDAYIRVANSVAFWNASRSVVLVTEDAGDDESLRLVAQRKANWSRIRPVERHRLEEIVLTDTFDPETGSAIVTSRMVFVETADDIDGADVLGPQKTTKTETAETLLEALLGDGDWHEAAPVKRLLDAAGFNDRLAQRAAKDLGIQHERRGFPASTWWRLPVTTAAVATNTVSHDVATADSAQPSHSEEAMDPLATRTRETAQLDREPTRDTEAGPLPPASTPNARDERTHARETGLVELDADELAREGGS